MATVCKNCGAPVVFDPKIQKVVCNTCGSSWNAEDIEAYAKDLLENVQAVPAADQPGGVTQEFMQYYVYSCSSCGGEIVINGSEISTTCIYCGSQGVVFNRIAKDKRPDYIIPFSISKDEAVNIIRSKFRNGVFMLKELKEFKPEAVRGIYIPYWLVDVYHAESTFMMGNARTSNNSSAMRYFGRTGHLKLSYLPVEACKMLNDESSARLEPYDMSKLKPFDEDYLLGFYSNMSDLTFGDLRKLVSDRASSVFENQVKRDVPASSLKILGKSTSTLIDQDLRYAMLPIWFMTVTVNGKPHTILLNGQTGKLVCGLPWSRKRFIGLTAATTIGMSVLAIPLYIFMPIPIKLIATVIPFLIGLIFYKKVKEQVKLTQDSDTFNFASKRQGGDL